MLILNIFCKVFTKSICYYGVHIFFLEGGGGGGGSAVRLIFHGDNFLWEEISRVRRILLGKFETGEEDFLGSFEKRLKIN